MSEQAVEFGYRTVKQLADHLGVSVHVVYRNVRAGTWKGSRTSSGPKSPIRFSARQTAVIEALMEQNGEQDYTPAVSTSVIEARNKAIERGIRRRNRR